MMSLELIQNSFRPNRKLPNIRIQNDFLEGNINNSLLYIFFHKGDGIFKILVKMWKVGTMQQKDSFSSCCLLQQDCANEAEQQNH